MRKKNVVLQHGTLPLVGDVGRVAEALYVEVPEDRGLMSDDLRRRATTLATALGREVTFDEAATVMTAGFARALNLNLLEGAITPVELARAGELRAEKYAAQAWSLRL